VLEKDLEGGAHGATLSKGEGPYNQVGGERGLRDQDYAARPLATGQIRTVVLVSFPQSKGKGFQEGAWECVGDKERLCFNLQLSKVEVFPAGAQPIAWEDSGVSACGLSIKLDSQRVNGDGDVWVEEALHAKRPCKQSGLGEVFVLRQ